MIPNFLRWAQYLCSLTFAINLVLINEFLPANNAQCACEAAPMCESILKDNDIYTSRWWAYALVLLVLFVGFRVIAAILLVQRAQRS